MVENSFDLLRRLKELGFLKEERDPFWWPNSGTFEVVVGAILTQNTKWQKVQKALLNLKNYLGEIKLEKIADIDQKNLATLIKPAGFYNTKAKRIKTLSLNILNEFGCFETFKENVDREWLLSQKGVGKETADSILNYACYKDVMVADSYTAKILSLIGYEFSEYDDIASFLKDGIEQNLDLVYKLYNKKLPLSQICARFHGKIVDFSKENLKNKETAKKLLAI